MDNALSKNEMLKSFNNLLMSAEAASQQDNYELSLKLYQSYFGEADKLDPEDRAMAKSLIYGGIGNAYKNIGMSLQETDKQKSDEMLNQAIKNLETALELNQNYEFGNMVIAKCYLVVDPKKAVPFLDHVVAISANISLVKQAKEMLILISQLDRFEKKTDSINGLADGNIVAILQAVKDGIDFNEKTGSTNSALLHIYAEKNLLDASKLLIQNGANVNIQDGRGATPLHIASLHGYKELVELLMSCGADNNIVTNDGLSALDFARHDNHNEIINILSKTTVREVKTTDTGHNYRIQNINKNISKGIIFVICGYIIGAFVGSFFGNYSYLLGLVMALSFFVYYKWL